MLIGTALLLAETPDAAAAERLAWYGCLDSYAQVEMLSARSPAGIAVAATAACARERKAFQLKLFGTRTASDGTQSGPTFAAALAEEDRAAAKHVIAFVNRNR